MCVTGQTQLRSLHQSFCILSAQAVFARGGGTSGKADLNAFRHCQAAFGLFRFGLMTVLVISSPVQAAMPTDFLKIGLKTVYDSNFFRLPEDVTVNAGRSRDDIILTPRVDVRAMVPLSLQTFELTAHGAYNVHRSNETFDAPDFGGRAGLNWTMSDLCSGILAAAYERSPGKLEDTIETSPSRVIDQDYAASGRCQVAAKIAAAVFLRRNVQKNSSDVFAIERVEETGVSGRVTWSPSEKTSVSFIAAYRDLKQPNFRLANSNISGAAIEIWDFGGEVKFALAPKAEISVKSLYTEVLDPTNLRDRSGITGAAEIRWSYSPKLQLRIYADRQFANSASVGAIGYDLKNIGLETSWFITAKWKSNMTLAQQYQSAERLIRFGPDKGTFQLAQDKNFVASADISYLMTDIISASAGVRFRQRTSNFQNADYSAQTVFLQLEYGWR